MTEHSCKHTHRAVQINKTFIDKGLESQDLGVQDQNLKQEVLFLFQKFSLEYQEPGPKGFHK